MCLYVLFHWKRRLIVLDYNHIIVMKAIIRYLVSYPNFNEAGHEIKLQDNILETNRPDRFMSTFFGYINRHDIDRSKCILVSRKF